MSESPLDRLHNYAGKKAPHSPELDNKLAEAVRYQKWFRELPEAEQLVIMEEAIKNLSEECSKLTD